MNSLHDVIAKWKRAGIKLSPPIPRERVVAVFEELKRPCSDDVLKYFSITGGMPETSVDEDIVCFWTLAQLREENLAEPVEGVSFCDVMIFSFTYEFRYESQSRSSVYGNYRHEKLADSVEEFFQMYLARSERLDLHWDPR